MSNNNSYWFVDNLIKEAEDHLRKEDYKKVLADYLSSSNHDHSGWTEEVSQIYHNPQGEQEKDFMKKLHEVNFKTVVGLLKTLEPSKFFSQYVYIGGLVILVRRISQKKSYPELMEKTKKLVKKSIKLGANENLGFTMPAAKVLEGIR